MSPSTPKPAAQLCPSPKRNRWLDWKPKQRITADSAGSERTEPSKLGSVGFVGSSLTASPIKRAPWSETELPLYDPYAERMRAALCQMNPPGCPSGMVLWLATAHPHFYAQLTSRLPDEIHRLWTERAPLQAFEALLEHTVSLHRQSCALYQEFEARSHWE
jgi:hypothetical protein